jgi:hypothetical protein
LASANGIDVTAELAVAENKGFFNAIYLFAASDAGNIRPPGPGTLAMAFGRGRRQQYRC